MRAGFEAREKGVVAERAADAFGAARALEHDRVGASFDLAMKRHLGSLNGRWPSSVLSRLQERSSKLRGAAEVAIRFTSFPGARRALHGPL